MLLGVNIDHIAVLREARQVNDPCLLEAAFEASKLADSIVIHVREDARHTKEHDLATLIRHCNIPINLECSPAMTYLAHKYQPARVTLVPEKRKELTTEGGLILDDRLASELSRLQSAQISTSLFIEASSNDIHQAAKLGAKCVELHTGLYANLYNFLYSNIKATPHSLGEFELERSKLKELLDIEYNRICEGAKLASSLGLEVAAGHGLNYKNVKDIASIAHITELNVGQSIVARSVFVGLNKAIKEFKRLIS